MAVNMGVGVGEIFAVCFTERAKAESVMIKNIYPEYLQGLLHGERSRCLEIVQQLLEEGVEIKTIYLELFQGTLYEVGELWERNRISVATEHLATSITESAMGLMQPHLFARERTGKKAVVSCVANEFHQVGGKMVADIFELHGWDGYFLGANTPLVDLLNMLTDKKPHAVCLSLSIYSNLPNLLTAIEALHKDFPRLEVLVGGQAFRWGGREKLERFENVKLLSSLDELEAHIHGVAS